MNKPLENVSDIYPLTPLQQGMLFHSVSAPGSGVYIEQIVTWIECEGFSFELFRDAWDQLLARHGALRCAFVWDDLDEPLQVERSIVELDWEVVDLQHLEHDKAIAASDRVVTEDKRRDFSLNHAPLMRMALFRFPEGRTRWLWTRHHLLADGWSTTLILGELASIYNGLTSGNDQPLGDPGRYRDYIAWLKQKQAQPALDREFWQQYLGESPLKTEFHLSPPISSGPGESGHREIHAELTREQTRGLSEAARRCGVTLNTVVQGCWALLLDRYSGGEAVSWGSVFSGRSNPVQGVDITVGLLINTVPLKTRIDTELTPRSWLPQLQRNILDVMAHEHCGLSDIQEWCAYHGESGLFDSLVVFENYPPQKPAAGPEALSFGSLEFREQSNLPLVFIVIPGERLKLIIIHDQGSFSDVQADLMLSQARTILESLPGHLDRDLSSLPFHGAEELQAIRKWSNVDGFLNPEDYGSSPFIDAEILRQASCSPATPAIVCGERQCSYEELAHRSKAYAAWLQQSGIPAGSPVALCLPGGIELCVWIVSVLRAGSPYVVIDHQSPAARKAWIADTAGASLVICEAENRAAFSEHGGMVCIAADVPVSPDAEYVPPVRNPGDPAYLMFTSGSSGQPKGVEVSHLNLFSSTRSRFNYYDSNPASFLLLSPLFFDSSVAGVYWTLAAGGTLVIPGYREEQDMGRLLDTCQRNAVTHTLCLPALFRTMCEHAIDNRDKASLANMQAVICAGEAMQPDCVTLMHEACSPETRIYNEYGPTEATVWCSVWDATEQDPDAVVPIGRPPENSAIFILDSKLRPAPLGCAGEIVVAGSGLATGYIQQDDQAPGGFVKDLAVLDTSMRVYRTGDLGRYGPDGEIIYLGRLDNQVKIRGHRIEPAEVEYQIELIEGITGAIVIPVPDSAGNQRLSAYVMARDNAFSVDNVPAMLSDRLPGYMIPSTVTVVDSFPTLPNGKVDRRAIQACDSAQIVGGEGKQGSIPETPEEILLADIWGAVLDLDRPGIDVNFFEIGGDSIQSIRVLSRVVANGFELDPGDIFQAPTIRELATRLRSPGADKNQINGDATTGSKGSERDQALSGYALTDPQNTYLFSHLRSDIRDPGHIQVVAELEGNLSEDHFVDSVERVVARHLAMRSSIQWSEASQPRMMACDKMPVLVDFHKCDAGTMTSDLIDTARLNRETGLDVSACPHWKMALFSDGSGNNILLWDCHHALIDGWSASLVVQEIVSGYQGGLETGGESPVRPGAADFDSYLAWLARQDFASTRLKVAEKFRSAGPDNENVRELTHASPGPGDLVTAIVPIDRQFAEAMRERLAQRNVTFAEMIHAIWALVLRQVSLTDELSFFVTVSGRNVPVNGIESMVGQFMTHLPLHVELPGDAGFEESLARAVEESVFLHANHHISASMIEKWSRQPVGVVIGESESAYRLPTLVMVENFPWQESDHNSHANSMALKSFQHRGHDQSLHDFDATSSFPVSLIAIPDGDNPEIQIVYNQTLFEASDADRLASAIASILGGWLSESDSKPDNAGAYQFNAFFRRPLTDVPEVRFHSIQTGAVQPETEMESQLAGVWKGVLQLDQIGVEDNFFDIGGTSILAASLAEAMERQMGMLMPLAALIRHNTIRTLARYLSEGDADAFRTLVEIQGSGNQRPVFGIHAEGNVLFYRDLAELLGSDRPFYGLQSRELGGSEEPFRDLESMADAYVREIRNVQPSGPYIICGMCFGGWVAYEMAQQLVRAGEEVSHLFIFDSGGPLPVDDEERLSLVRRFSRLIGSNWGLMHGLYAIRRQFLPRRKRHLKRIAQNHRFLKQNYRASNYGGKVIFLRSQEWNRIPKFQRHIDRWSRLSEVPLETHLVDGEHGNILEPPQVYSAATIMKQVLDRGP